MHAGVNLTPTLLNTGWKIVTLSAFYSFNFPIAAGEVGQTEPRMHETEQLISKK